MRWIIRWYRRWIGWLLALLVMASCLATWRFAREHPLISRVDRTFQDWLIDLNCLPKHSPVPVTLVEMEDAENWSALEYSLFLKALPLKNAPVVVFTSMPEAGHTAFHRAFNDLAIKQSRLILPIHFSQEKTDPAGVNWWLKGWDARPSENPGTVFTTVDDGLPEMLRGTVEVGVANLPKKGNTAVPYFPIGKENVPSLALRAAMLARRVSDDSIHLHDGLIFSGYRFKLDTQTALRVDATFLPGIRRIASSDLLLSLAENDASGASQATIDSEQLQGVLVLGDLSENARTLPVKNGRALTPAEWIATTVATLCNSPVLTPLANKPYLIILILFPFLPLCFNGQSGFGKWLGCLFLIGIYILGCTYLAGSQALAAPLLLPVAVLVLTTALQHLAAIFLTKKHERNESN